MPFCYDGTKSIIGDNGYQNSTFAYQTAIKGLNSANDNYQYKGQPIFGTGGVYSGKKIGTFKGAPQAQSLLFCGGTSTTSNNIADAAFSGGPAAKFPTTKYTGIGTTPEFANQPTSTVKGDKVILGFK